MTTRDPQKFRELHAAVVGTKISYPSADFPIKHIPQEDDKSWFTTTNGVHFKWSEAGAGYLSERNTRYKYAQFTALVRKEDWAALETLANTAIDPIKGSGKGLIFAMVDERVVGILRHYNMVDHRKMLATIVKSGLSGDVIGWDFNDHYMSVDLASEAVDASDHGELEVGIRIINGHSGHHALQYRMLVKSRGYEFSAPTHGRSRHLTGVGALELTLKDALETIGTVKLDDKLLAMSPATFAWHVRSLARSTTARQESLLHLVETTDLDNGMDCFVLMGQYANTKGYTTAVANLLDPLVKRLLGIDDAPTLTQASG